MIEAVRFRSPLHDETEALGATFADYAGWLLPERFATMEQELEVAMRAVAVIDRSAAGKFLLEGTAAGATVRGVWQLPPLAPGRGASAGSVGIFQVRPDQVLVFTAPEAAFGAAESLRSAARSHEGTPDFVTLSDLTHAQSELWLIGPHARDLLSRLCGLDFHPSRFPNLTAQATSVAKMRQLVRRRDLGGLSAFGLTGAQSLGAYLWRTALEAGSDLGARPAGLSVFQTLMEAH